jgi:hypothetical protein
MKGVSGCVRPAFVSEQSRSDRWTSANGYNARLNGARTCISCALVCPCVWATPHNLSYSSGCGLQIPEGSGPSGGSPVVQNGTHLPF